MSGPLIVRETAAEREVATPLLRVAGAVAAASNDMLAVEEPLEIHLNGWRWLVTMRTPGHDPDLVIGMLASEGAIATAAEVSEIVFRRHPEEPDLANVVDVRVSTPLDVLQARLHRNHPFASASCGLCGASGVAAILQERPPLPPGPEVDSRALAGLPAKLAAAQPGFATTGGVHAAGLFDTAGTLLAVREDVGRHNAVDKVLGWQLRALGAPAASILLVSGRASFEIVQKAVAARLPIVAAVSAPSSLAVSLARHARLTLAGFVRDGGYNLYAGDERVTGRGASRDPEAAADDPLSFIPGEVRTALDDSARKIGLADWRALTRPERERLVTLATHACREDFTAYLTDRVTARTGNAPRPR